MQTGASLGFATETGGNWQVAWVSPDARYLILGRQDSESTSQAVLFTVRGSPSSPP